MDKYQLNLEHNETILELYNLKSLKEFPQSIVPALASLITWQSKENLYGETKTLIQLIHENPENANYRLKNLTDYIVSKMQTTLNSYKEEGKVPELAIKFPTLYQLDKTSNTIRIQGLTPMQWLQLLEYTANNFNLLKNHIKEQKAYQADLNNNYIGYSPYDIDPQFSTQEGMNISYGKDINSLGLDNWEVNPPPQRGKEEINHLF